MDGQQKGSGSGWASVISSGIQFVGGLWDALSGGKEVPCPRVPVDAVAHMLQHVTDAELNAWFALADSKTRRHIPLVEARDAAGLSYWMSRDGGNICGDKTHPFVRRYLELVDAYARAPAAGWGASPQPSTAAPGGWTATATQQPPVTTTTTLPAVSTAAAGPDWTMLALAGLALFLVLGGR